MGLAKALAKGRGGLARVQKSLTRANSAPNPAPLAKSFRNPFISEER
jgi:hypothetical protein